MCSQHAYGNSLWQDSSQIPSKCGSSSLCVLLYCLFLCSICLHCLYFGYFIVRGLQSENQASVEIVPYMFCYVVCCVGLFHSVVCFSALFVSIVCVSLYCFYVLPFLLFVQYHICDYIVPVFLPYKWWHIYPCPCHINDILHVFLWYEWSGSFNSEILASSFADSEEDTYHPLKGGRRRWSTESSESSRGGTKVPKIITQKRQSTLEAGKYKKF